MTAPWLLRFKVACISAAGSLRNGTFRVSKLKFWEVRAKWGLRFRARRSPSGLKLYNQTCRKSHALKANVVPPRYRLLPFTATWPGLWACEGLAVELPGKICACLEPQYATPGGSFGTSPHVMQKMQSREFTEFTVSAAGVWRYSCQSVTPWGAVTAQLIVSPLPTFSARRFTSVVVERFARVYASSSSVERVSEVPFVMHSVALSPRVTGSHSSLIPNKSSMGPATAEIP